VPEGDAVWLTARRLHEALSGRTLTLSDFRVPRHATADLRGRQVVETRARGKHLLTRVEGALTIHTHLKMDGSWRTRPTTSSPPRDHRIRLILATREIMALGYSLGIVELLRTEHESRATGHLGPDLLGDDWDAQEAVKRLKAAPETTIGEALLDQTNLAGIGTIYRAETLFLQRINPWRKVADVTDLEAVAEQARTLLQEGIQEPRRAATTRWVYGRARRPCRRCGTPISQAQQGPPGQERVSLWCPSCQRT
jgi:endonuclease-8